jgi:endonuclease YncB( thermonuclease family)
LIAHAKIVRVQTDGTLTLADGQAVRLEGILLPAGARDHAPEMFARWAIAALTTLATGASAVIAAAAPIRDRYGRIRAQVLTQGNGEVSLQLRMLRNGLARVSITPDRRDCAQELYAAEEGARTAKLGIWASPAYLVRTPSQLMGEAGTFQIVKGKIDSVTRRGGRIFLDFGPLAEFAVVISPDDLRNFHAIGVDPYGYGGGTVRVRGWIERVRGRPEIEIATPDDVEVIQRPDGPEN